MSYRVLVTGAGGMLAHDLTPALRAAGWTVTPATRRQLDITDARAVEQAVTGHDVVVNAAAWTAVDAAESAEPEAFAVNAVAPALLARACARHEARLVHLSSDYVFDGQATTPYAETHPVAPQTAYGRTKAAGEWAVRAECPDSLIVRTAWLYGAGGGNFVATMRRLGYERETVQIVTDQRGQPTWTRDLAGLIVRLLAERAPGGVYHGTSAGEATWFEFARAIFAGVGWDPERVHPTTTARLGLPAQRPAFSVLGCQALPAIGIDPVRDWHDALTDYLSAPVARRSH